MMQFFQRNSDAITIVIISVSLSFLLNNGIKILNFLKKSFKKFRRLLSKLKRKIKREYTINELIRIEKIPENNRSKRQKYALNKYKELINNYYKEKEESKIKTAQALKDMNEAIKKIRHL